MDFILFLYIDIQKCNMHNYNLYIRHHVENKFGRQNLIALGRLYLGYPFLIILKIKKILKFND